MLKGGVVEPARLAGEAVDLGLDAVEQGRRDPLRNLDVMLHQVLRDDGTGRPDILPDVEESDVFEIARRLVMIDDGVYRTRGPQERMSARARLAVDHDDRVGIVPDDVFDRHEIDVEDVDHRPILGPADLAVARQAGRNAEALVNEMGQPHHACEAVRIRLDVRYEGHGSEIGEAGQELIRASREGPTVRLGCGCLATHIPGISRHPTA